MGANSHDFRNDNNQDHDMSKKKNIAILGFGSHCTDALVSLAGLAGRLIAQNGWTLITCGIGGVFEAARKEALEHQGMVVSLIEQDKTDQVRHYSALLPVSSTSLKRMLAADISDAGIILGGWTGTLDIAAQMAARGKPVIALKDTGGAAGAHGGRYLIPPDGGYIDSAPTIEAAIARMAPLME